MAGYGDKVITAGKRVNAGEDFAFMLEARPGAFIFLCNGTAADGSFHSIHTPQYDFNDEVIPIGVGYWVSLVQQQLNSEKTTNLWPRIKAVVVKHGLSAVVEDAGAFRP